MKNFRRIFGAEHTVRPVPPFPIFDGPVVNFPADIVVFCWGFLFFSPPFLSTKRGTLSPPFLYAFFPFLFSLALPSLGLRIKSKTKPFFFFFFSFLGDTKQVKIYHYYIVTLLSFPFFLFPPPSKILLFSPLRLCVTLLPVLLPLFFSPGSNGIRAYRMNASIT